ncbi:MAG: DsbE family thiol:disulfide interchange protein [Methylococcales symbiont of Iophon sp. n. MRB-2018]|nr:MAG: DsbE family thiol:disulfide interchange protein [Methylococcales symbiont of Iophon sp. n. MRB-2018]
MLKFITPLILFIAMVIFLAMGLSLNPRDIPSPLINKPAPEFSLPILATPEKVLSKADMAEKVWLLNVWASWCSSCRAEHPVFNELVKMNIVPIIGLNYKDEPWAAQKWLNQLGNPYQVSIMDREGRTGIDYGVYAVPETFVIDKKGLIRYKHTGVVKWNDVQQTLLPMIKQLNAEI